METDHFKFVEEYAIDKEWTSKSHDKERTWKQYENKDTGSAVNTLTMKGMGL